jgi:tetratricopeptide (TPR) repeat protein
MSNLDDYNSKTGVADNQRQLQRGRGAYRRRAWAEAYKWLLLADGAGPLDGEDLALLAASAYLIGREEDYLRILENAYHVCLDTGKIPRAIRCAFWLGLLFVSRGEKGPASGWLNRGQRLLDRETQECVERGYLLLPVVMQRIDGADWRGALAAASDAAEIGEHFGETDLIAAARHFQGRVLIREGQVEKGLALLDEAMIAVTAEELSPLATGMIYCSVIDGCQEVYELGRAREWTAALADWCEEQPGLVFTGKCLVHRSQIMQMNGAWRDAIEEAQRASQRLSQKFDQKANAEALYQQAELHRLRGEFEAADESYQSASQLGW